MSVYRDTTKITEYLVGWIKEHFGATGAKGAVLGISGGIDSAVLTGLLCRSIGKDNVLGVIMPCHSQPVQRGLSHVRALIEYIERHAKFPADDHRPARVSLVDRLVHAR